MWSRSQVMLSRLQIIGEELEKEAPPATIPSPPNTTSDENALLGAILLGLKILSTRSIAVLGHLIPLIAIGSGFALWWSVRENPSVFQLTGLGLYAAFMLLVLLVRRGK